MRRRIVGRRIEEVRTMQARPMSWRQKVAAPREPKRVTLEADFAGLPTGTLMFVATPRIVEEHLRRIPLGESRTIQAFRDGLAKAHGCDAACPVSTAVFVRMVAEAAWEDIAAGCPADEVTPFWRVIAPGSAIGKRLAADADWIAARRAAEGL
jgi:hypothetical protein